MDATDRRIVLVTRRTRLQELVARHNTVAQARFHAEHLGMDFDDFTEEDRVHAHAVAQVATQLEAHGRVQRIERAFLPNFLFPPDALVVVVGQDGLVANTLKYLDAQPLIAINPDPARYDGVLLPFGVGDVRRVLPEALSARRPVREVAMAEVRLSDGQRLRAVNDVFIGARTHVSARYELTVGEAHERQSSSGIIVSTGLGSTGWLRSVLRGATVVAGGATERIEALRTEGFAWESRRLVFSVREPFPSKWSQAGLVFGDVLPGEPLRVRSLMPEGGVIFSDGVEADALDFQSGLEAVVSLDARRGRLVQ